MEVANIAKLYDDGYESGTNSNNTKSAKSYLLFLVHLFAQTKKIYITILCLKIFCFIVPAALHMTG